MCGICGFTGEPDRALLQRMCDLIQHRGPNDEGMYWDEDVSLGMRRLSIIDLATGRQPMSNETGDIWTVYNGEIYNFQDLRRDLQAQGHRFASRSDTEVIVHLYEQEGADFVHKLNGMFAIALWDKPKRKLLLYRDRIGIKPLYYFQKNGHLVFGSEIKVILESPLYSKAIDLESLHHYLTFKNVPAPRTIFQGICSMKPGERIEFAEGQLSRQQYWRPIYREDGEVTEDEAAHRIRELLEDSVRMEMVSDVPIGAYLSGGVDSSAVVALMSRHSSGPVITFSLVYEEDFANKVSDTQSARRVARLFGTDHHEYVMSHREIPEQIDEIIGSFDEPFCGVISTFFISKLIKQHVKVALSGDGADEMFGSYLAHRLAQPIANYLRMKREGAMDPALLTPYENRADYVASLAEEPEWKWRFKLYVMDEAEKRQLYTPTLRERLASCNSQDIVKGYFEESTAQDPLNRVLDVDCRGLLPDQVLAFVDKLSMAHSIEVRPPFLDHRLFEFVATLPGRMKIRNGVNKYILKKAVTGLIPDEVINRPKEGFILPLNTWLLGRFEGFVRSSLSPSRLARHGFFGPEGVAALLDAHYTRQADHSNKIWALVMFQLWFERFFPQGT